MCENVRDFLEMMLLLGGGNWVSVLFDIKVKFGVVVIGGVGLIIKYFLY